MKKLLYKFYIWILSKLKRTHMSREKQYQELLRIATEQIEDIRKCIQEKQQSEIERAGKEVVHSFYSIDEKSSFPDLKFSIGLKNFLLKLEIITIPTRESFALKIYEIVNNMEDYGKLQLKLKTSIDVTGNFMKMTFTKTPDTFFMVDREKIGTTYLQNLLSVIDGTDNPAFFGI